MWARWGTGDKRDYCSQFDAASHYTHQCRISPSLFTAFENTSRRVVKQFEKSYACFPTSSRQADSAAVVRYCITICTFAPGCTNAVEQSQFSKGREENNCCECAGPVQCQCAPVWDGEWDLGSLFFDTPVWSPLTAVWKTLSYKSLVHIVLDVHK